MESPQTTMTIYDGPAPAPTTSMMPEVGFPTPTEEIREEEMPEVGFPTPTEEIREEEMPEVGSPTPTTEVSEIREEEMPEVSSPTPTTAQVSEGYCNCLPQKFLRAIDVGKARARVILAGYWPWIVAPALPLLGAFLSLINKKALNEGMDFHVFCTYRNVIAFVVLFPFVAYFERGLWPHATWMTFLHVVGLAIMEPLLDQNFTYAGLQKISASLAVSFGLLQPVIAFTLACLFRYERVRIVERPSQLKIAGTLVALIGAVFVALSPGHSGGHHGENPVKGIVFCVMAMFSAAFYFILLTKTVADFDAPLSITAFTSLLGAVMNFLVALVLGRGSVPQWLITRNASLLAYAYSGVMVSAVAFCIANVLTRVRGPVFVTSFSPLSMVIVTVVGTAFLGEQLHLTRILAACGITLGMSLLLWGKAQERQAQQPPPGVV